MSKHKSSDNLWSSVNKKSNTSTDYVFYSSVKTRKKRSLVSPNTMGKRSRYKFFSELEGKFSPLRCMVEPGRPAFVISPEATRAFQVPVVKRILPGKASDV
jgi:hypothetical protein